LKNEDYSDWYELIKEKLKGYKFAEIYNCDEKALFYKMYQIKGICTSVRNVIEKYKD
jgi:hypothetical protein